MSKYRNFLVPLFLLIFIKLVFIFPGVRSLEYKAQDGLFQMRGERPVSDDILLVAIDDETFNALNISWPFPREYHAKLIENLRLAGARLVVFDIEFTESSRSEADEVLADMAMIYDNVVFAGKVLKATEPGMPEQLVTPIPQIMNYDIPWGIVNMGGDSDNVIRKYTLFETHDGQPIYSIGMAALANYKIFDSDWAEHIHRESGHLKVGRHRVPIYHSNKAIINYYGPAGSFPQLSYSSILDDSTMTMPGYQGFEFDEYYDIVESGLLQDKIVLIGATIDELHDKFPTPFGGEWTPGVEIHANFIQMALSGEFLFEINPWLYFALEIILLFLAWLLFSRVKPQLSAIFMVILIVLQFFAAYALFVEAGILIPIVQTAALLILVYVSSLVCHYLDTMKEKRFIRQAFQQYMAPELVGELLKNPENLSYGGSLQDLSVLFSDIRGFTTYTESHTPEETVNALKEYLTDMVSIIIENEGIVDKFIGDEIMALFGTPLPLPNHALNACKVALEMRERMTMLQQKWAEEGKDGFEIGIGINTGQAVVGNLGSEQIFDYTAIGDTINLGARLEAINKEYETKNHIIISEFTLELVKDLVEVRFLDEVKVKGKNKAVKIYELIGLVK